MKFDPQDWHEDDIDPMVILLDQENARIGNPKYSQDVIVRHLIDHEDVIGLSGKIEKFGGLFPIERVLLAKVGGKLIVLEGNRRVCACQLLLRPTKYLNDEKLISKIPRLSSETKKNISKIKALIVEIRDIGDPIVANVHAGSPKLSWSPINQMRWAYRRVERGKSMQEVADDLHLHISDVQKLIREYRAIDYTRSDSKLDWSDKEKEILSDDYGLDFQPYLRVILSPTISKYFGTSLFLEDGRANFSGAPNLHEYIKIIATHGLIAQRVQGGTKLDRQTNIGNYLTQYFEKNEKNEQVDFFEGAPIQVLPSPEIPYPNPFSINPADIEVPHLASHQGDGEVFENPDASFTGGRVDVEQFFERFETPENSDTRIKLLLRELRRLSRTDGGLTQFPLSFSMLMRAFLEWGLTLHLKKIKKWKEIRKGGHDPRLSEILRYCANPKNRIFDDNNISNLIKKIQDQTLEELNRIMHNDLGNHSKPRLEGICGDIRPVMRHLETLGSLQKLGTH